MRIIQSIAVFCGSSDGNNPIYKETASLLGSELAKRSITLVFGGGNRGLMGALARAVHAGQGKVVGVIPSKLNRSDVRFEVGGQQLIVTSDMHERKATMYRLADAFVALPGGIGTFEEILEAYTWLQLGYHQKPIALLNTAGYYDELLAFLEHSSKEGFLRADHLDALIVENDIHSLLDRIMEWDQRLSDKLGSSNTKEIFGV